MKLFRRSIPVLLLLLVAGVAGCSKKASTNVAEPNRTDELNEVGGMIREFQSVANRGPASPADLAQYGNMYKFGYTALQSGEIVMIAGAKMGPEGGGGREVVVAYEKKAPTDGGLVLLENGQVKQMSSAEFNAAPKAK